MTHSEKEGAPPAVSPRLGQSLSVVGGYETSVPVWPCRSTGRVWARSCLLGTAGGGEIPSSHDPRPLAPEGWRGRTCVACACVPPTRPLLSDTGWGGQIGPPGFWLTHIRPTYPHQKIFPQEKNEILSKGPELGGRF